MKKYFFFFFLFANFYPCLAQSVIQKLSTMANENLQGSYLQKTYDSLYRYNKDSNEVIGKLNEINQWAESKNSLGIQALSFSLLADHYARIRQYNSLSTTLHQKAILIAKKSKNDLRLALCYYKFGRYNYSFKKYLLAFENLLKANHLFTKNNENRQSEIGEFYFFMGSIYAEISSYKEALYFFKMAAIYPISNKWFNINALNNIGLIYHKQKNIKEAENYFKQTIATAQKYNYPEWVGIATGNLGILYFSNNNKEQAIPLLKIGLQTAHPFKEGENSIEYLSYLMKWHLQEKQMDSALYYYKQLDTTTRYKSKYQALAVYYDALATFAEAKGNFTNANNFWKKYQMAQDSVETIYDAKLLSDIALRLETDNHIANINLIEQKANNKILQRNSIIVFVIIICILLFLFYLKTRKKAAVEKELLLQKASVVAAKEKLKTQELANAQKQLQDFTLKIQEKNQLLEALQVEYEKLNIVSDKVNDERTQTLNYLVQKTILTNNDWEDFKKTFSTIYPYFLNNLKQQYPDFTQAETRLLVLQKLQLSTSEMALLLGISTDSVKKTKQRLRKKITSENADLEIADVISNL